MAKRFKRNMARRFINGMMTLLIRAGIAPRDYRILTVRGRRSGRRYSTPVRVLEHQGRRWLVAPYGERAWVKNARAAGEVALTRRFRSETFGILETEPAEATGVLRAYVAVEKIVRPYFAEKWDAPADAFLDDARTRPVFQLMPRP